MPPDLDARYVKDPNVVYREIAGEQILIPIRKQVADMAAIFVLNETGARIWDLVDDTRTLADIRDALVEEYEVEAEVAAGDLLDLVEQLAELGMLKAV